jgi:carbonic anhydrase/acetyltransferase-like protein (isoleucine patch superfamily)
MIYEFNGYRPVIHQSSYVHPQANVTGNVIIGAHCYIGPGAVLRGDWGEILVADGCNIQENCVVHMFPGKSAVFEEGAHIGHGAIIHGATVGKNVLIGMNAVLMDDVQVGENSIVGALCFVPANMIIPAKSLVVGNPAKIIREVSNEMIDWKTQGTKLYQQLPTDCHNTLRECEPLREKEPNRPEAQQYFFKTWADKKAD